MSDVAESAPPGRLLQRLFGFSAPVDAGHVLVLLDYRSPLPSTPQ